MKEYDVVLSSKGQFVLPKEIRDKFGLSAGSKIKVIVDGEHIILRPRTVADELEDLILADIVKVGKPVTKKTINEYHQTINRTLDKIVAAHARDEAAEEYKAGQFVTLDELKKENQDV